MTGSGDLFGEPKVTVHVGVDLGQLFDLVQKRRDQLRRDELAQAEHAQVQAALELRQLHDTITAELNKHGLGWMKAHVHAIAPDGMWEKCVELWKVEWRLPAFRPFCMILAKWTAAQREQFYDPADVPAWKLAGDQTAGECPSWEAENSSGGRVWCHNLIHALDVALVDTLLNGLADMNENTTAAEGV